MRKKFNAVISVVLTLALALTGVSYVSSKSTEADTVAPLKTIAFDSEADIVAVNDSAAKIVEDATRGQVISLGAGDATRDMDGAQISNPWADATVNPDGAKEYNYEDISRAFNRALAIPYGEKFFFKPSGDSQYPVRAEGDGGITWKSLTVSTAAKQNGAVAEGTDNSINDSTGNYRGAEVAQKSLGDTYASTVVKKDGVDMVHSDGNKVKVSAYKVEKEADYVRPVWEKKDGLTMSFWVNVPEGTTEDTILFSFFNERIVAAMDPEAAATFNNLTGHLWVRADGSIEFAELSLYAGDPSAVTGNMQISRYEATRNKYQTPSIGKGVNAVSKAGQWVCVTLVCENDYISVYFDGIQVNYIESNIPTKVDTANGAFTQDWDNPENSPNWTRTEAETTVKTFNGWFCSRNTPTYTLVNSGVYSAFPAWTSKSAQKMQPCPIDGCTGGSILASPPRITLCQWLQDSATTLYLGGAGGKDLSTWGPTDQGTEDYACVNQYTVLDGTMFDSFEFYNEALTSAEVATAYVNAGGTLATTPEPTESEEPTPTESEEPTPTESEEPTPTESEEPTPTESEEPTPTESEEPTDTPEPEILIGDINDDGVIDASDALLVLKYAAKMDLSKDTFVEGAAHTNADGIIDANDALNILKVAAKLIDKLPVE